TSAEIQMGETTVEIGGFVRMDAYYDFEKDNGPSLTAAGARLKKVNGSKVAYDDDGQMNASAKYTRLSMSFDTPTSAGDIGGYIEADFFGDNAAYGDSGNFHLRKAYLTYGNWLIGQTDSSFTNDYFGPAVDWGNPEGDVASNRVEQ